MGGKQHRKYWLIYRSDEKRRSRLTVPEAYPRPGRVTLEWEGENSEGKKTWCEYRFRYDETLDAYVECGNSYRVEA
jgi:hypothetical protein